MCDFAKASECIEKAKQANTKSGHDRVSSALDVNLAHIETMLGRFQRARETFNRVVNSPQAVALDLVGAYEGLARLHLTLNELDECEATLDRVDGESQRHQGLGSSYHARWAVVTRARLLLKRGNAQAALDHLRHTEWRTAEDAHLPSTTALHLAAAEAHIMLGGLAAAVEHLTAANVGGGSVFREFQAQHYYTASLLARVANRRFATHLRQRAIRLSSHQGAIAVRMQMEGGPQQNETESKYLRLRWPRS